MAHKQGFGVLCIDSSVIISDQQGMGLQGTSMAMRDKQEDGSAPAARAMRLLMDFLKPLSWLSFLDWPGTGGRETKCVKGLPSASATSPPSRLIILLYPAMRDFSTQVLNSTMTFLQQIHNPCCAYALCLAGLTA